MSQYRLRNRVSKSESPKLNHKNRALKGDVRKRGVRVSEHVRGGLDLSETEMLHSQERSLVEEPIESRSSQYGAPEFAVPSVYLLERGDRSRTNSMRRLDLAFAH